MLLRNILSQTKYELICGSIDTDIVEIEFDSRKVKKGYLFVCLTGSETDGHMFIKKAIENGAVAVLTEKDVESERNVCIVKCEDTRRELAVIASVFYGEPQKKLFTIGITGTKGKTTTSFMVRDILEKAGIMTGVIGTIETIIGDEHIPSSNSTPENLYIYRYFKRMLDKGCKCVVMEVSSQGLKQYRVHGIVFDIGVFTNIEPDHIGKNEHADFEEYLYCKSLLFKQCKTGIFNVDDAHFDDITRNAACKIKTFGSEKNADILAKNIILCSNNGKMSVSYDLIFNGKNEKIHVGIPGKFSAYNSLAAISICEAMKEMIDGCNLAFYKNIEKTINLSANLYDEVLSDVKVKGRAEPVDVSTKFTLMIDYAHNAMSLGSLLKTLKEYKPKRLVCLFGCGGNRSPIRRWEMGEISASLADITVVTSDNPRNEKPEDIICDILKGVERGKGKYVVIPDRREAIKYCLVNALEGDVIVLAGKGHEDYQEICGVKYPMDERKIIEEIKNNMTDEERKAL